MSKNIRILIADDHTIFRSGLRLLLASEPGFEVIAEAEDGAQAIDLANQLRPDVILMDIGMPGINGYEATQRIKASNPEINVLVLTMHRSEEYFFKMLDAGASGYVLKGAETDELIHAVHTVAQGDAFLYPSMARRLVDRYLQTQSGNADHSKRLTPREEEILQMVADGYSNNDIAEKLVVSPSTVHSHRTNIMTKLGLSKRHELVQYARDQGLI
ncbi:MAG: response regulator transcription factor [Anaerolineales bacterium]|nr:MAG: response regulator transcription factor [Anaerolineales bacterium]